MTAALLAPRATHPGTGLHLPWIPARPTTPRSQTGGTTTGTARTTAAWKRPLAQLSRWTVRPVMLLAVVSAAPAVGPHVLGQVTAVIPELGNLIHALRTPVLSQALVYGAPALLAGWLLPTIWTPTRTEDQS